jgi:energy-coupling factor transporter ATP-binding protein EcfA2
MDNQLQSANRILILGKSGSGKSTLARKLSGLLSIKHVELDTIFWKPNWVMTPIEEMRVELEKQLPPDGQWVVDGNYRKFADITWSRAQVIVWLDYPLLFVLWRLFLRSVWRIWTKEKVCGENYERGSAIFSPNGDTNLLMLCVQQWRSQAKDHPKMMKEYGDGKMLLVFRHERECEAWLEKLRSGMKMEQEAS